MVNPLLCVPVTCQVTLLILSLREKLVMISIGRLLLWETKVHSTTTNSIQLIKT